MARPDGVLSSLVHDRTGENWRLRRDLANKHRAAVAGRG